MNHKWLLAAILAVTVALRVFQLGGEGLWYDELYTVFASRLPPGELMDEIASSGHPPAYFLLVHYWNLLDWGEGIRLLSVAFGIVTVLLAYLLGRDLFSRRAGLWAAALAAVAPALVWYARDITMYGTLTALATLALYLLVRGIQRGGWINWSLYTLSGAVLIFTYFFAAVFIVAATAVFVALVSFDRRRLKPFVVCQLLLAATAVLSLPLVGSASGMVSWTYPNDDVMKAFRYGIVAAPFVLYGGWEANLATGKAGAVGGPPPRMFTASLAASLLLMMGGMALGDHSRRAFFRRETLAVALYLVIMVVLPIALLLAIGRVPGFRFYVWAAPAFILLLAVALSSLRPVVAWGAGAVIAATMLLFSILGIYDQQYHDSRGAMELIAAERQSGDQMLCVPLTPCVLAASFYLEEEMPIRGGETDIYKAGELTMGAPGTTWSGFEEGFGEETLLSGAQLEERLAVDLAAADRVWLVAMNAAPATAYTVTRQWEELYCREFAEIKVCLYDK